MRREASGLLIFCFLAFVGGVKFVVNTCTSFRFSTCCSGTTAALAGVVHTPTCSLQAAHTAEREASLFFMFFLLLGCWVDGGVALD